MIRTRFAPSPTGKLHVGNARTAIVNWLFARKMDGEFLLRIDDTDLSRSTKEFEEGIIRDLKWLNLGWDDAFRQSARMDRYEEVKQYLISIGRLYPCYETPLELDVKKKTRLSAGLPPIYDRAALKLTEEQKKELEYQGHKPHYRFLLRDGKIEWDDMIKGKITYEATNISDPIVIRQDGTLTYMLCSIIDDMDYAITHILRGEDHVSNTAIQMQMFDSLGAQRPMCGHMSLIKAKDNKISKRVGGFEIEDLRNQSMESMSIVNFFSFLGSSQGIMPLIDLDQILEKFDISTYSKNPTTYQEDELLRLNRKIVAQLGFEQVRDRLPTAMDESFWEAVRPNLDKVCDADTWWKVCREFTANRLDSTDLSFSFFKEAIVSLPDGIVTQTTWKEWTKSITAHTGAKGKELYMPLRLAITGMEKGPELSELLPLIGRREIVRRLEAQL